MEEIWKDIKGYEGLYRVSNMGNVESLNYHNTGKTQILRPIIQSKGYLVVALFKDGKPKRHTIHRLVAAAFLSNPLGLPQVNHIDEDKTNNRVENLEWCDCAYNHNYGTRNEKVGRALLNNPAKSKRVRCVETGEVYPSIREAARRTRLMNSNGISGVCCKKPGYKTAGGFHWEFVTNSAEK